jgi:hypothetical protein
MILSKTKNIAVKTTKIFSFKWKQNKFLSPINK